MKKIIKKSLNLLSMALIFLWGSIQTYALDWDNHWAADYIASARNSGWADMRDKGNFEPSSYATREEVVYMLYASQLKENSILYNELADDLSSFLDSDRISPKYRTAFKVLVGNKVLSGYKGGTLNPQGLVTRAEMAKLISYFIPEAELSKPFYGFSDIIPTWAKTDIERCSRAGIVSGYSDNTFRASNKITRGEVVRMIQSLLEFTDSTETTTQETTKVKAKVVQTTTKTQTTTETTTETTTKEKHIPSRMESTTEERVEKPNDMESVNKLYSYIKNKRFEEGSSALQMDMALCDLAYLKAKDMYITNYNQIYTTTYGALENVLGNAGIKYMQCGMVIASNIYTPEDALTAFENNQDYNTQLLDNNYTRMGAGVYEDRWVVILTRVVDD